MRGVSVSMPAIAANDSCSEMLAAAYGLASRISSKANDSEVIASLSRPNSGASSTRIIITVARTIEGDAPTASA